MAPIRAAKRNLLPDMNKAKEVETRDKEERKTYIAKDGEEYYDIQIGRGVLLPNKGGDKAPEFRGPFNLYNLSNEVYTLSVWKRDDGGYDARLTLRKPNKKE